MELFSAHAIAAAGRTAAIVNDGQSPDLLVREETAWHMVSIIPSSNKVLAKDKCPIWINALICDHMEVVKALGCVHILIVTVYTSGQAHHPMTGLLHIPRVVTSFTCGRPRL